MAKNPKNPTLSEVLDINKIKVVNQPIEKAHGLPNEYYTSPEYLKIERERVFKDKWTAIGVGSLVPNPGDALPYSLLGIPIIILRDKDKKVRVFHNVCSHRCLKLVDEKKNVGKIIRCPYHSWSYDLEGKLKAAPHVGGTDQHQYCGAVQ